MLAGEEDQLKKPQAGEKQVVVMNGIEVAVTLEMIVVAVTFEIGVVTREKGKDHQPEQIEKKVELFFLIQWCTSNSLVSVTHVIFIN